MVYYRIITERNAQSTMLEPCDAESFQKKLTELMKDDDFEQLLIYRIDTTKPTQLQSYKAPNGNWLDEQIMRMRIFGIGWSSSEWTQTERGVYTHLNGFQCRLAPEDLPPLVDCKNSYKDLQVGDYVTNEFAEDQLNALPPAYMSYGIFQMGEPYDHKYHESSGGYIPVYATFVKCSDLGCWRFEGYLFRKDIKY